MHSTEQPVFKPKEVSRILTVHAKRWIVPAVVISALAAAYAAIHLPTWEASQALIVRNEVTKGREELGRFSNTDEMKTVQ